MRTPLRVMVLAVAATLSAAAAPPALDAQNWTRLMVGLAPSFPVGDLATDHGAGGGLQLGVVLGSQRGRSGLRLDLASAIMPGQSGRVFGTDLEAGYLGLAFQQWFARSGAPVRPNLLVGGGVSGARYTGDARPGVSLQRDYDFRYQPRLSAGADLTLGKVVLFVEVGPSRVAIDDRSRYFVAPVLGGRIRL
ncbi:MAG: hypothetical protein NW201_14900 [Gemmatimonadales bacterium]|nr:hypothetical protein [Gemmatimonadales bacterium]